MSIERFKEDVAYEVGASTTNVAKPVFEAVHDVMNKGEVQWPPLITEMAAIVGVEGLRLIEALVPRYELALTQRASAKRQLEEAFRSGLDEYISQTLSMLKLLLVAPGNAAFAENMLNLHRGFCKGGSNTNSEGSRRSQRRVGMNGIRSPMRLPSWSLVAR